MKIINLNLFILGLAFSLNSFAFDATERPHTFDFYKMIVMSDCLGNDLRNDYKDKTLSDKAIIAQGEAKKQKLTDYYSSITNTDPNKFGQVIEYSRQINFFQKPQCIDIRKSLRKTNEFGLQNSALIALDYCKPANQRPNFCEFVESEAEELLHEDQCHLEDVNCSFSF